MATSTNILFGRPDGGRATLEQTLRLASAAGFRRFDLNFYDWSLPGTAFLGAQWETWINDVAQTAADLGVTFGQCHAYFYNFTSPTLSADERAHHHKLQLRSLECCRILGAHTCVMHPETDYTGADYYRRSSTANKRFYSNMLETVTGLGMRIAIENMCDYGIAPKRKFCAYPEELLEFVGSFCDNSIGVCWDFEHADIMEQEQVQALELIGNKLFATHVSDTYSKTDPNLMHVLPLTGTIDWPPVMQALTQIGYEGDFAFEVHNYVNRLPDPMVPMALSLAYQVGEHLMSLA